MADGDGDGGGGEFDCVGVDDGVGVGVGVSNPTGNVTPGGIGTDTLYDGIGLVECVTLPSDTDPNS